ncbi:BBP7 family outer membrane beta-barrel protein [Novipirellula herctigrandis]
MLVSVAIAFGHLHVAEGQLIEVSATPVPSAITLPVVSPAAAAAVAAAAEPPPIIDYNPWRPSRPRRYFDADLLLWWAGDSSLPSLLTTNPSGTPIDDAGLIGSTSTSVLYGNDTVGDWAHVGFRMRFGRFVNESGISRLEIDLLQLFENDDSFGASSSGGDPILARPFYNSDTGANDAQIISFPGIADGSFDSDYERKAIGIDPLIFFCLKSGQCRWWEFYTGYRFFWLRDKISIREHVDIPAGGLIAPDTYYNIHDTFTATNAYHLMPLGLSYSGNRNKWIWNVRGDIGFGFVSQTVEIEGSTQAFAGGVPAETHNAGFLALQTNRGKHDRTRFAWVPQINASMKRRLTDKMSAQFGYTVIYLHDAVKAVDHLPTAIDPGNLPPELPGAGPNPVFAFNDEPLWVHGFNIGLQFNF